jgi:hypothetical protein
VHLPSEYCPQQLLPSSSVCTVVWNISGSHNLQPPTTQLLKPPECLLDYSTGLCCKERGKNFGEYDGWGSTTVTCFISWCCTSSYWCDEPLSCRNTQSSACHILACFRWIASYDGVSKSFWTGCLEWELQMVQLSATRCCITILWVSLVSFATTTFYVASQWVFVVVDFVIDSVQKLLDTPLYRGAVTFLRLFTTSPPVTKLLCTRSSQSPMSLFPLEQFCWISY